MGTDNEEQKDNEHWEKLLMKFEELKKAKEKLLKEDELLEMKAKYLRQRFQINKEERENIVAMFDRVESEEITLANSIDECKSIKTMNEKVKFTKDLKSKLDELKTEK